MTKKMKMNIRIGSRDNKRMKMWKALTENTEKSKYKIAQECFYLGLEFYYGVHQQDESRILGAVKNQSQEGGNNTPRPSLTPSSPHNSPHVTSSPGELSEKSRILKILYSKPDPEPLDSETLEKQRKEEEERQLQILRQTNPGIAHMLEVGLELGAELREELKSRRKGNGD